MRKLLILSIAAAFVAAALALSTAQAWMLQGIQFFGAYSTYSGSTSTTTITGVTAPAGAFIIVGLRYNDASTLTCSASDGVNTYTAVSTQAASGNDNICILYASGISALSSGSIAVTATGGSFTGATAMIFTGVAPSSPLDGGSGLPATGAVSGTVTSVTSSSFSTAGGGSVVVGYFNRGTNTTTTWTPSSGFIVPSGATDSNFVQGMEYQILSAPLSSATAAITSSASAPDMQIIVDGFVP